MLAEAKRRRCRQNIEAHTADLESESPSFMIEPDSYDLIANFYYLRRPLFPAIRSGLRFGGILVAAIHVESPHAECLHRFLLEPGELERMVVA